MKKVFVMVATGAALLVSSCGTSKKAAMNPAVESTIKSTTSLEGEKVLTETFQSTGIEMSQALNDEGTAMIDRPYKWFAGRGRADDKQMAIEIAQREAYATLSRVLNNAVYDEAERGDLSTDGKVQQAIKSHWKQVSTSLEKACEPFGNTTISYSPNTKMYEAVSKIGIRGDRFNQLLNSAGDFKPSDLKGDELNQFIQSNKAIMEAARGN